MKLDRVDIPVYLDISNESNELKDHLLQGSEDTNLLVTLKRDGVALEVPDTAKITLYCFYKIDEQSNVGCGSSSDIDLTKNNYVLDPLDSGYNIVIENGQIKIPVTKHITNAYGKNLMILKIDVASSESGQQVTSFSYDMTYYTDKNYAYTATSSADNLPHFDDLKKQVEDLTQKTTANKQSIDTNTAGLQDKADHNLDNVGEFSTAKDGSMFYKKDNLLKESPITVDDANQEVHTRYSWVFPPNSIRFGMNTTIHQNGGYLEYHTESLDKNYLIVDYENDPQTGSLRPILGIRGTKETKVPIQSDSSIVMNKVSVINLSNPQFDRQVQRIYFKLVNSVDNLKIKLEINGRDVADYPNGSWEDDSIKGYYLQNNDQYVDLLPFWSSLSSYNIKVYLKADNDINMLGNGVLPYIAEDLNRITFKHMAYVEDGGSGGQLTAEQIRNQLVSLKDTNRLPATAIKDLPEAPTASELKNSLETLTGDNRLDSTAIKNLPQGKDAATIASELNVLTGGDRVDYKALKNKPTDSIDSENLIFNKSFGIKALNNTGSMINENTFVMLSPNKDKRYEISPITTSTGYNGEMFGILKDSLLSGSEGRVTLIDTIQTELTSSEVSEGIPAYIGFESDGSNKITISKKDNLFKVFGKCGVFGKQNDDGKFMASFDNFIVQSSYYGENAEKYKDLALKDLSNVDTNDLYSKGIQSNLASDDMSNISSTILDQRFKETTVYRTIWNKLPDLKGLKGTYIEENDALSDSQFTSPTAQIIHLVYQINTNGKIINQVLPSININKVMILQIVYSSGVTSGTVKITPKIGEALDGSSTSIALSGNAMQGILISDDIGWNWIPYKSMSEVGIAVNDQRSNFFTGIDSVSFGNGFEAVKDANNKDGVKINYIPLDNGSAFEDTEGQTFSPDLVRSALKDIEIHKVMNPDGTVTANLNIAPYFNKMEQAEGIHYMLGQSELLNSKRGKTKMYFSDPKVKGGSFVYKDMTDKSFIMQDTDPQDDPNVSGGTTFIVGLHLVPDSNEENIFTQDGYIDLELVDDSDNILTDINGNPMGIRREYKVGDKMKEELYLGEYQAKGQIKVHLKVNLIFQNEEVAMIGPESSIMLQSITKDESSGPAIRSFMIFTGYILDYFTKYYGFNSLNLAQFLIYDLPEKDLNDESIYFGNGTYLNVKTKAKASISSNNLNIKDNGNDLITWSLGKTYSVFDTSNLKSKTYKVTVSLEDKDSAYEVALLTTNTTTGNDEPIVEQYTNDSPIFTTGWTKSDSMFITENVVSGIHTQSKEFTIPNNIQRFAVVMYPNNDSIPNEIKIKDFEGDITPWINRTIIKNNSHLDERALKWSDRHYTFWSYTPKGMAGIRYTINSSGTSIPWGLIHNDVNGIGLVVNGGGWHSGGNTWRMEGDGLIKKKGKVLKLTYTAQAFNETNTDNAVRILLAKVKPDGSFDVIPGSTYSGIIPKNTTKPYMITKTFGPFDITEDNTKIRVFGNSDIEDGFYLESFTNGVPLLKIEIEYENITEDQENIQYLMNHADEVTYVSDGVPISDQNDYRIQVDVKTNNIEVKKIK